MFYEPTAEQIADSDHMLQFQHAYLWADPGTGKTVTAMEAFRKGGFERGVVLGPPLALLMWQEELEKHLGLRGVILYNGRKPPKKIDAYGADFLITTHDLAKKHTALIRDFTAKSKDAPKALILDESQAYKTATSQRTVAVMGPAAAGVGGIWMNFDDVWQLTGTPILRHVDDLYPQLRAGRQNVMKAFGVDTYQKFVNEFCVTQFKSYHPMQPKKLVVTGSRNEAKLKQLLDACQVIRRELDPTKMPGIKHRIVEVGYHGTPPVTGDMREIIKELNKPDSPLNAVWRKLGVAKSIDVAEYVASHGNAPVLVGFWHTDVMTSLMQELKSRKPNWVIEVVNGATSSNDRERIRDGFNAGKIDCILGQMAAMNSSWNLQEAASHVVIAEELPSPGMVFQFFSRVYRRGQKRPVQVDYCTTSHGIDEALRRVRNAKASTIAKLI